MLRVYLAGFDVFSPDSERVGDQLKAWCQQFGMEGLYPADNDLPAAGTNHEISKHIFEQNMAMIRRCDVVMANLNSFRGYEPDSGTMFEVGAAHALGKQVWGYLSDGRSIVQKIPHKRGAKGYAYDQNGWIIEDFDLPVNLMIAHSVQIVVGSAFECLAQLAKEKGLSYQAQ